MIKEKQPGNLKIVTRFMRLFFRLLYHPFAWTYDLVAATVSLGRWNQWVLAAVDLLPGPRVLELGFGPGHLQGRLFKAGKAVFGLDESWQMARQARRRLVREQLQPKLARGIAQHLPFASACFDNVTATFPTLYIIDPKTLAEIQRVLVPGGRLVVLMAAWLTGTRFSERVMQSLFRVTAQTPPENQDIAEFLQPYQEAGFQTRIRFIEKPGSRLMFIIASSPARQSKPERNAV